MIQDVFDLLYLHYCGTNDFNFTSDFIYFYHIYPVAMNLVYTNNFNSKTLFGLTFFLTK